MNIAEVAVRAVTYVAAMLMFGASMFVIYVPSQVRGDSQDDHRREWHALRRYVWRLQLACAVATLVAGLFWLAIHSAAVAGVPLVQAVSSGVAGEIVGGTMFGRAMGWHLGLAMVLTGVLVFGRVIVEARSPLWGDVMRAALSVGVLATLAWMGHAAATQGSDHYVHLGADIAHLLAAGAWLGALPLLALVLTHAAQRQSAALDRLAIRATRRFSPVGVACVAALLITGTINAWYLVATPPALLGTSYGQLLLLKLALFALMLALAMRNRFRLTPRIDETARGEAHVGRAAMRQIARNGWMEATLGVAIVAIVGALGISIPGAHTDIVWPLPFTLDPDALDEDHRLEHAFSELILVVLLAIGFALHSLHRRRPTAGALSTVVGIAAIALLGYLFVVPAHPTTYARSPVRYTTAAIAAGATVYRSNCTTCHGDDGQGDGPAAVSLPVRPANLTSGHALHHLPGGLYWRIAHGIPGTPMAAFEGRLTPAQTWQLVTFLHALADAQEARKLNSRVGDWRPIAAPDFTFEIAGQEQETLEEQRGQRAVLLVLYVSPESRTRLLALDEARETLGHAGVRVLAIPFDARTSIVSTAEGIDPTMVAFCDPSVAAAYSLFIPRLPSTQNGSREQHAEVLIDRNGYVRSVLAGLVDPSADRIAELVQDARRLDQEPSHPPASRTHGH